MFDGKARRNRGWFDCYGLQQYIYRLIRNKMKQLILSMTFTTLLGKAVIAQTAVMKMRKCLTVPDSAISR